MAETLMTFLVAVSFAKTPGSDITDKYEQITALGWEEKDRGDPWVVAFEKQVPESQRDPEAELRSVMGDYWLTADAMRSLRQQAS